MARSSESKSLPLQLLSCPNDGSDSTAASIGGGGLAVGVGVASVAAAPWQRAIRIALCFLGAAVLSWLRAARAGTLRVDQAPVGWPAHIALCGCFGLLAAAAGVQYLRAMGESSGQPLGRRLGLGALLIHCTGSIALPFTSNDLFSNLAYGRLVGLGLNPYLASPRGLGAGDPFAALVGARWLDAPSNYGPVLNGLVGLIGRTGSVLLAMVAFKLLLLGCSLVGVALAFHICRRLPSGRAAPAFVLFAWNPLLVWELSAQAHNDGLMVLALLGFVAAALDGRTLLATLSLTVALWTKFAAAPLVGLWLVLLLHHSPGRAIAMAATIVLNTALVFLPYWVGKETLAGPLLAAVGDVSRTDNSLTGVLCFLVLPLGPAAHHLVYIVCRALGAGLLFALGMRALTRAHSVEQIVHDVLLIFLAYALVAAPWFQPWYLSWLMPLALIDRDPRLQRVIAIYSVLAVVQYAVPVGSVGMVMTHLIVLVSLFRARSGRYFGAR